MQELDWADYGFKMDELTKEKEKILEVLVPKTIMKPLPPLVTLDDYTLNEEQGEIYKKFVIQHNEKHPDPAFNINNIIVPKTQSYTIGSAGVKQVNCRFIPYIIKFKNLPAEVTSASLKTLFTPYVSDSKTVYYWNVCGKISNEPYPYIYIGPNRTGAVYFDSHTKDAQFALVMMMRYSFNFVLPNGEKEVKTIFFSHSLVKDKELPLEITKMSKPRVSNITTPSKYFNSSSKHTNTPFKHTYTK